ncbi:MAG: family 78 glycoside hydrolase catalytic domain [Melioribacteraceae bacterium]|nr:family 78 glycoside hydrolase catalytic domain [Melioribacteraceae bacterium]
MKLRKIFYLYIVSLLFVTSSFISAQAELKTDNLRTEYKTNPIGIDIMIPRLSWELTSDKQNTLQTKYEIRCSENIDDLLNGKNLIWESALESDQSVHIEYKGSELKSRQRVFWQVRIWDNYDRVSDWSEVSFWEMGLLKVDDWEANWIEADLEENQKISEPAQYFRKEFKIDDNVKSARLYITSHGLYEAYINGSRVGEQVLTPGWTSYNKRLQYQTYDVTDLVKGNGNAIGTALGDGWYRGFLAWENNRNVYGGNLGLIAQLEIEYSNGKKEIIISDDSWKATNDGPILSSDIYNGEIYDARKELKGWTGINFNDEKWDNAVVKDHSKEKLISPQGPLVKEVEEIKPIGIIMKPDGKYIFDLGQNMVGWIKLKVEGKAGTVIKLRHAEVLDKYGEFYTANLRAAKQEIEYILKGDGEEIYNPHFTFQGFRYVEVSGFPGEPTFENLTGVVVHSDMTPAGTFVCSDSLINQLQHNIVWGLKGNFVDVPTDCPQRDERLGWTGDAQVFAPTACFNMDAASFYTKWMKDVAVDQGEDGSVSDVVPNILGGSGHTGWADVAVVVPWTIYKCYGDKRILEEQYESMKAWIGFMKNKAGDDYLWDGDWHYGDWLSFDDESPAYMGAYTETDLIATAYFAYSTNLLSKIAGVLGKVKDSEKYTELSQKIKDAFITEFVTPKGRLVSNTQTAYTLALAFNILPKGLEEMAAENLAKNVERFKHITTGFLGTPIISQTLTRIGRNDLAYMLLTRKKYPSWLYPVTMGATTIWERWDGQKPDSTFQNIGMNSFNHYAYGAIGNWLYSTVAGIRLDETKPGYKSIIIDPNPGGGLTSAAASIKTIYGKVSSSWEIIENKMHTEIVIPPNTQARFILADNKLLSAFVDGVKVNNRSDLQFGSGKYVIIYDIN